VIDAVAARQTFEKISEEQVVLQELAPVSQLEALLAVPAGAEAGSFLS